MADELQKETNSAALDDDSIFKAVTGLTKRVKGSYAVVSLIAGFGLLAFRDPFGIRPLCIGRIDTPQGPEWMLASESVALEGLGFTVVRDVCLQRPSPVQIAHTTDAMCRQAIRELDGDDVDAIVQVGTNLACAEVAASAERWLGKRCRFGALWLSVRLRISFGLWLGQRLQQAQRRLAQPGIQRARTEGGGRRGRRPVQTDGQLRDQ